ncbi:hypothetical protein HY415_01820 [Candidatus Kaiserbacteria bacterium]|nr:hypothetical protein [Candidatus Kaiserbacteria bacterium]
MENEIAYKVMGIEMKTPINGPGCNIDLGSSPESLKRVAELLTSLCDGKENFAVGFVRFHIREERTGRMGIADISMTKTEMFLTVPA